MTAPPRLILDPPTGWRSAWETNDGAQVRVWRPPPPTPGVLRVLTDTIPADGADPALVTIKMREVAFRFVRPDDNRASDRVIEDRDADEGAPGSCGLVASAVMATVNDDGEPETHYLWMIAEPADGAVMAAMAALAVPGDADGGEDAARLVAEVDQLIRNARLSRT